MKQPVLDSGLLTTPERIARLLGDNRSPEKIAELLNEAVAHAVQTCVEMCESQVIEENTDEYRRGQRRGALDCVTVLQRYPTGDRGLASMQNAVRQAILTVGLMSDARSARLGGDLTDWAVHHLGMKELDYPESEE